MKRRSSVRLCSFSTCLQCGLIFALVWVLFTCFWLLSVGGRDSTHSALTELNTCPACYGHTVCNQLRLSDVKPLRSNVTLASAPNNGWWSIFSPSTNSYNVKNVFETQLRGQTVVLKKLSHDDELAEFDTRANIACIRCSDTERLIRYRRYLSTLFGELVVPGGENRVSGTWPGSVRLQSSPPTLLEHFTCLSRRGIDLLYGSHADNDPSNKFYHAATMLLINPEPLIIQAFSQSKGFPFPRYRGACGRVVAEQYLGRPLSEFYHSDWRTRLQLALQLLEICSVLTEGTDDFSLYITDFSADNLVVDGTGRLHVVDLENVVIVDHYQVYQDHQSTANVTHVSPVLCDNCMGYEPEQLCRHIQSDHNYMAVCRGLLYPRAFSRLMPGGLLHNTPDWLLDAYPHFMPALELCADPTLANRLTPSRSLPLADVIDQIANQRAVVGVASGSGDQSALSRIEVAEYLSMVMNRMLSELLQ